MVGKSNKYPNRLRETIKRTGLTIKEVAEESAIPLRTLSDYCAGNAPVPRKKLEDIALVIGCSPQYLVPDVSSMGCNLIQSSDEETDDWIHTRGLDKLDLLRRDFLLQMKQFASLAGISLLAPSHELLNPDAWEKLLVTLKKSSYVDEQTLLHLETLTDTYCDLYHITTAQPDLLSSLSGHLITAIRLLKTNQPASVQSRLCAIASSTAQMFGEICYGMENMESARTYYQLAAKAAKEGKNNTLQAIALAREGFLPADQGKPYEALPPLRAAYALAETSSTGETRAWIMMMEAEALARIESKKRECLDVLKKVEETFYEENDHKDEASNRYDHQRWTGFHYAALIRYKGQCFLDLHKPEDARSMLLSSLVDLSPGPTRNRALIIANLALSYVQSQDLEIACDIATQALAYTAQAKSLRALKRLRQVQQELHPWQNLACVRRFSNAMRIVERQ